MKILWSRGVLPVVLSATATVAAFCGVAEQKNHPKIAESLK